MANDKISLEFDLKTKAVLDSIEEVKDSVKNLNKTTIEGAQSIGVKWGEAFSKITVIKDTIAGLGSYFNTLTQGPRLMETAMASLSFVSKEVKDNYNGVRDSLLAMGRDMPIKSTAELAGVMKDLAADGYSLKDSLELTKLAAKGAVAGLTDTGTALGGLKNIMSAYKMDISEATRVQDLLFKSVQMTGENYASLSNSIAGAMPSVSAMGIGFEDFLGSVTALTQMNVPVNESIGIMEMAAKQLTMVLGDSYMQTHSLTDAMLEVYEKANGSLEEVIKTVGKPELAKAILMIGQNADDVQSSLIEMGMAAGTTEEAYESSAGTTDNMIQLIKNNLNDVKETMMTTLLPAINAVVEVVKDIVQWVGNFPVVIKTIISGVGMLTAAFVALKVTGLMEVISSMGTMLVSMKQHIATIGTHILAMKQEIATRLSNTGVIQTSLRVHLMKIGAITAEQSATTSLAGHLKALIVFRAKDLAAMVSSITVTKLLTGAINLLRIAKNALLGPLGWVLAGVTVLAVALYKLFSATDDVAQKQKEAAQADLERTESTIKQTEACKEELENNKKLLTQYEALATKTNKTAAEEKKLADIAVQLNSKYDGLIQNNNDWKDSLGNVQNQITDVNKELAEYIENLSKLSVQKAEKEVGVLESEAKIVQKELTDTYSQILGDFSSILYSKEEGKSAQGVMQQLIKEFYANSEKDIFSLTNGYVKFQEGLKGIDALSDDQIKGILESTDKYVEAQKEVFEGYKKVNAEEEKHIAQKEAQSEKERLAAMDDHERLIYEMNNLETEYKSFIDSATLKSKQLNKPLEEFLKGDVWEGLKAKYEDTLVKYPVDLINQHRPEFQSKFAHMFPEKKQTSRGTKEKDNTAEFYKHLYESEQIEAEKYIAKVNELIDKVKNNKEYQKLSQIDVTKLSNTQRARLLAFEKEIEGYNKSLDDIDKKTKEREEKLFKEAVDKQEQQHKIRKELYEQDYISSATYLKNLDGLYDKTIDTFAKDNKELSTLLEDMKLGKLVGEPLENAIQAMSDNNPELAKKFQEIIDIAKNYQKEMNDVQKKEAETRLATRL